MALQRFAVPSISGPKLTFRLTMRVASALTESAFLPSLHSRVRTSRQHVHRRSLRYNPEAAETSLAGYAGFRTRCSVIFQNWQLLGKSKDERQC